MLFRRKTVPHIIEPVSAFVHQLSDKEMQKHDIDIKHIGAVINIKSVEKEEILMVGKLEAYRAELEAKRAAVLAEDFSADINAKVTEFRDALIKSTETARTEHVKKIDSDIHCINGLIAREQTVTAVEVTASESHIVTE